jgi:hypothetical protein
MKKEIRTYNSKGEWHGYIEVYNNTTNKLWYRANCKNDFPIGYKESHKSKNTNFHIR